MKISLIKRSFDNNRLDGVYQSDIAYIHKMKTNVEYIAEIRKPRNPQFHRKVFALAKLVVEEAQETSIWSGKDAYSFIKACEIQFGYVDYQMKLEGEAIIIPKSIAFESMTQDEFQEFYDKMCEIACGILQCSRHDIDQNVVFKY